MASVGRTYVIFDADEDDYYYFLMKAWKKNDRFEFDFSDAHDLTVMTSRARDEAYVKGMLRERMKKSDQVIVLIGQKTKNLYKYVRWEIELAAELNLPIIAVNLNGKRRLDEALCPAILRPLHAIHISFNYTIIKHALEQWPAQHNGRTANAGWHYYEDSLYERLGL